MRRHLFGLGLVCALTVAVGQADTLVNADYVVLFDGATAVFGDQFDTANLQTPPWIILSGSPGPGNGSTMPLHGGDSILAPVTVGGQNDVALVFNAELASFPTGSSLSILLFGQQAGDFLSLALTPDGAVVSNEAGALGGLPFAAGANALMSLSYSAAGIVTATVNGTPIFAGPDTFAPATAIGIVVVPEPATCLLVIGGLALGLRRR